MNLKQKILKLLDVYYPEGTSDEVIQRDLTRRGKIDQKKVVEILFLIIKEVDELKETKSKK